MVGFCFYQTLGRVGSFLTRKFRVVFQSFQSRFRKNWTPSMLPKQLHFPNLFDKSRELLGKPLAVHVANKSHTLRLRATLYGQPLSLIIVQEQLLPNPFPSST